MLWRGSRDGFDADTFHRLCNGIPNTLVLVKSTTGCIFGGFTRVHWQQGFASYSDASAFIFSLKNPANLPLKLEINPLFPTFAVESCMHNGPIFGSRQNPAKAMLCADLLISDNSNKNSESHMLFTDYKHPMEIADGEECGNFIHGGLGMYFTTQEIEVFSIILA